MLVCAKSPKVSDLLSHHIKSAVVHKASMLGKVRHPHICFLVGVQTVTAPFHLVTTFYSINDISISVHDTLADTKFTDANSDVLKSVSVFQSSYQSGLQL